MNKKLVYSLIIIQSVLFILIGLYFFNKGLIGKISELSNKKEVSTSTGIENKKN